MKSPTFIAAMSIAVLAFSACGHAPEDVESEETEDTAGEQGAIALFEGRTLDLSRDWGEAKSCLIWTQAGISECFRTDKELEAREAEAEREQQPPQEQATASAQCSGYLHLYEHVNFGGRHLAFRDRGYWQDLGRWGFNDKLSSFTTGPCGVHLSWDTGGRGGWYPGNTGAYVRHSRMISGWNDEISSIYIR